MTWADLATLTGERAAELISARFPDCDRAALQGARRGERWIGLDGRHVFMISGSAAESRRLALEAKLIEALRRGGVPAPRVVFTTEDLQVRERIDGVTAYAGEFLVFGETLPRDRYERAVAITPRGEALARAFGRTLAHFHGAFAGSEAQWENAGLTPFRFDGEKLASQVASTLTADRHARLARAAARYAEVDAKLVVCHGDFNHHNFCSDAASGELRGVYDFGDACLGARELDFKFALGNGWRFQELSIASYEQTAGVALRREYIVDIHVLEAAANVVYAQSRPHHGLERCVTWLAQALDALAI